MKINKIIYWVSTILFAGMMIMSSAMYLTKSPELVKGFNSMGYPPFMLDILGVAKLLGAIALVQPKFDRLKEWAYAGFTINMIGAIWSHIALGQPFVSPVMFLALLAISYLFYHRILFTRTDLRPAL
jgi:uncharacterized membrane protein YphA (DoxX/SURF4 family)